MMAFMFVPGNTVFHRLSPVTKILGLIALFFVSMTFNHPRYLAGIALVVMLFVHVARAWRAFFAVRYILMLLFLFPLFIWSFYTFGTEILIQYKGIIIYRDAVLYGLAMGLRLDTMLAGGLVLLSTTRIEDFTLGLHKLGIPFRMSFALTLAFRLVPLFFSSFQRIVQAQESRGMDLRSGSVFARIKKSLPVLIPVFVSGVRRTEAMAVALEVKGFGYPARRTTVNPATLNPLDVFIIVLLVVVCAASIMARVSGFGALV